MRSRKKSVSDLFFNFRISKSGIYFISELSVVVCLFVFYVPSTARSFRDGTNYENLNHACQFKYVVAPLNNGLTKVQSKYKKHDNEI